MKKYLILLCIAIATTCCFAIFEININLHGSTGDKILQGLGYFAIGAAAGEVALYVGPALVAAGGSPSSYLIANGSWRSWAGFFFW
jgi:hypothetical protein